MPLSQIVVQTYFSGEATKLAESINALGSEIENRRAALESEASSIYGTKPEDFTPEQFQASRQIVERRYKVVQDELSLRRRMRAEWFPVAAAQHREERDRADARLANEKAKVREALLSIGFTETNAAGRAVLTDPLLLLHPAVAKAQEHANDLASRTATTTGVAENEEEITRLENWLKLEMRKLVAR